MRRSLLWLLLCFGCLLGSCLGSAAAEPSNGSETSNLPQANSYEAYADKVIAVDRKRELVGVSVYGYLGMESFEKLANASVVNPDLCIRLLSEKKYTEHQRYVAILAMYRLSVDQYVAFVRNLATLRDKGLISREELLRGLYPRLSVDTVFEHYQDKGVRLLLTELEARDDLSISDKREIQKILSGEALEERRRFDRECCSVQH